MQQPARLERIRRRFSEFALEFSSLPLYGTLAAHLSQDDTAASLLLAARPGQARPVLWLAALHDLVLSQPDLPIARFYASVVGRDAVDRGDPWPEVRETVLTHRDLLEQTIATHTTQTNEVNRCVYLAAAINAATSALGPRASSAPIALVELGASAGLLLGIDRYQTVLRRPDGTTHTWGDPRSPVLCVGDDLARSRVGPLPPIGGRSGIDLHPVGLADTDGVRWLLACLWPDVPGRVERFSAARALLSDSPPPLVAGDLVDDLGQAIDAALSGSSSGHAIVFSSWALTYVDAGRRARIASRLAGLAATGLAVSWITAEPPGVAPGIAAPEGLDPEGGGTVLGLRQWLGSRERDARTLGTCHPHGAWVRLTDVSDPSAEHTP